MAYPPRVVLTGEQRVPRRGLVGAGVGKARMLTRARILLKTNHGKGEPGWSDAAITDRALGARSVVPSGSVRAMPDGPRGSAMSFVAPVPSAELPKNRDRLSTVAEAVVSKRRGRLALLAHARD